MKEQYKLIIFDCDGVLVDTEKFYVELLLELGAPFGLKMPLPQAMQLFVGVTLKRCIEIIGDLCGKPLPADFFDRFRDEFNGRIEHKITVVDGIKEALDDIDLPKCVASNSSMGSIKQMLKLVGLYGYFEDRIFSGYDLQKWKPEPDLFLTAAREMKVDPTDCLVIEDSVVGVQAAKAAGMKVLAYSASEFTRENLLACGVQIFQKMSHLPNLIRLGIQADCAKAKLSLELAEKS